MYRCYLIIIVLFTGILCHAQDANKTVDRLNDMRLQTNTRGMEVLAGWGGINAITGLIGYVEAHGEESQRFYQMNAIWGVINFGIAGAGFSGTQKERRKEYTCAEAYRRYKATRRLYLINAGLDCLYIGTGEFLIRHSENVSNHPEVWRGYGHSLLLQGAGLLAFDIVMFTSNNAKGSRWHKVLDGVCYTGNGIGWHCSL